MSHAEYFASLLGKSASPAEPFNPSEEKVDLRRQCEGAGGVVKTQIQDYGSLGFRCIR